MRGETARDDPGSEGEGEVIPLAVRPVSLSSLDESGELLQSGFWGYFKQKHGWNASAYEVQADGRAGPSHSGLLVLTRRLARFFSIAYVPFGPQVDPCTGRAELLAGLADELRGNLPADTLFLRFDLPWVKAGERPGGKTPGAETPGGSVQGVRRVRKSASDMQPSSTVIVDIGKPLDDVLKAMKTKTRYNIRLAEKKRVTVIEGTLDDLNPWYAPTPMRS